MNDTILILNDNEAEACYQTACLMSNVGGQATRLAFPAKQIVVSDRADGEVHVSNGGRVVEIYDNWGEFAQAYNLHTGA